MEVASGAKVRQRVIEPIQLRRAAAYEARSQARRAIIISKKRPAGKELDKASVSLINPSLVLLVAVSI